MILSILLIALSLLIPLMATNTIAWKLSILAAEYGHWFALLALGLAAFALFFLRGTKRALIAMLTLASVYFFLTPLRLASTNAVLWQFDLENTFGGSPMLREPVIARARLWSLFGPKKVTPTRMVFDPKNPADRFVDFYKSKSGEASPWVVIVHGGGWNGGNTRQLEELSFHLADRGYAVASVSYRLAPAAKWPAQKEDILAAVDYLKTRHQELNIDPTQWAVLGRSAGGQLAEMVAFTAHDPALKGCVALYAPADLNFAYRYAQEDDMIHSRQLLRNLLGGTPEQVPAQYEDAAPIRFAGKDSPPTLLMHGLRDPITWYLQSRRLQERLNRAGAKSLLITLPWGTHGFDFNFNGPGGQATSYAVDYFLSSIFSVNKTAN